MAKDGKNRTRHVSVGVLPCKLKTLVENRFASKIILFQETFEFKNVIAFAMEGSNHLHYKDACYILNFG
jgi:hypothetical protein